MSPGGDAGLVGRVIVHTWGLEWKANNALPATLSPVAEGYSTTPLAAPPSNDVPNCHSFNERVREGGSRLRQCHSRASSNCGGAEESPPQSSSRVSKLRGPEAPLYQQQNKRYGPGPIGEACMHLPDEEPQDKQTEAGGQAAEEEKRKAWELHREEKEMEVGV